METKPCPRCGLVGEYNGAPLYAKDYVPPGEVWFMKARPLPCSHVEAIIANIQKEGDGK